MNKNLVLGSLLTGVAVAIASSSASAQSSTFIGSVSAYPNNTDPATLVYRAEASPMFPLSYSSANEYGDEVTLGGSARTAANFSFEYYSNFGSADGLTFRVYSATGTGAPGTELHEVTTAIMNGGATFSLDFAYNAANTIPDTLVWTVQFAGVGGANQAGLIGNATATTGTSSNTFWENQAGTWVESSIIPEPSTVALASVGGVAFLGMLFMRRNRK